MKNVFLKKIPMLCIAALLICCMVLSGCAGRTAVTPENFTAICGDYGYTVSDISASFNPENISLALSGQGEDYSVGYYKFVSAQDAKTNYAQFLGDARNGIPATTEEKFVDSAEYNRYLSTNEYGTVLLYRNGTTMLFISGADSAVLAELIDDLGV